MIERDNDANKLAPHTSTLERDTEHQYLLTVGADAVERSGLLYIPGEAHGLVIIGQGIEDTHQSGIALASLLHGQGLATFVVDLFSSEEQRLDAETGFFRANTEIMHQRLMGMAEWFLEHPETEDLSVGYFGSGAAGAASVMAAAERPDLVAGVVTAGARLELAREYLPRVLAPTLLIAGENDSEGVRVQQEALDVLTGEKRFEQVKGVGSLFESQQGLSEVARLASEWFGQKLVRIR